MGVEIERKFLVAGNFPRDESVEIIQWYLCKEVDRTVRVRMLGDEAFLTIKGEVSGITRPEFEYEIPVEDAHALMQMVVGAVVSKERFYYRDGAHTWEIDVFSGANAGLVVAEIELQCEDEEFVKPDWVGEEVTADTRYANSSLSTYPFNQWDE